MSKREEHRCAFTLKMIRFGVFSSVCFSLKKTSNGAFIFIQSKHSGALEVQLYMVSVEDIFATRTGVCVVVCSVLFSHPIHTRSLTWSTLPMHSMSTVTIHLAIDKHSWKSANLGPQYIYNTSDSHYSSSWTSRASFLLSSIKQWPIHLT